MRLMIDRSLVRQLVDHSRECHPYEACGLLFGRAETETVQVHHAAPAENIHHQPRGAFQVDWRSLLDALSCDSAEHMLVGFYHSHPHGVLNPSADDAEHAWPGQVMVICSAFTDEASALSAWRREPPMAGNGTRGAELRPMRVEFLLQPSS